MIPEKVRIFVPFSVDTPWVVRGEAARMGTFRTRDDAVSAAIAMRSRLVRAHGRTHPPVSVQESDGSWRDVI
ncbi:hypothetical protein [Dyella sp.]|uniref:hypothetical protein n=1 Tax=Dyella sp. TaxID=1869338 RepID=UPI002ED353AD